jgi:hypothetical protein
VIGGRLLSREEQVLVGGMMIQIFRVQEGRAESQPWRVVEPPEENEKPGS